MDNAYLHSSQLPVSHMCEKSHCILLYSHDITYSLNASHVCMLPCFVHFSYVAYADASLPELLKEPHQPVFNFPKRPFGQKKLVHCSLQGKWFSS